MELEFIENYETDTVNLGNTKFTVIKEFSTWYLYAQELREKLGKSSVAALIAKLPDSVKRAVKHVDGKGVTRRYVVVSLVGLVIIASRIQDRSLLLDIADRFVVPQILEEEIDDSTNI
jgi:hypothetical protein